MPLKLHHDDEMPALNLTSMIDVLFLLIIFFMVATKFDEMERNIQVAVPQVSQADDSATRPKSMTVTVAADGRIELDGSAVTLEDLTARLAAARTPLGDPSVLIRGDPQSPFQNVASALAACRQAGIAELGITVRIAAAGSPALR